MKKILPRSMLLLLLFFIVAQKVLAQPGITWKLHNSAADLTWNSITYGNGLFVAVALDGTSNRVMTSSDGVHWTVRVSAADKQWISVTYGGGLFIAVSLDGPIMTSPDGITWTLRYFSTANSWTSTTYGSGLFVVVARDLSLNKVLTSPDGINWTLRNTSANKIWNSVTYGNGMFVAVAASGSGTSSVMTSTDGINWTNRSSPVDPSWSSVAYGGGLFVVVAGYGNSTGTRVMTSPDGITWTLRASASDDFWNGVTYGNGLFVAVAKFGASSGNRVMTSPNGINWTLRTSAGDNQWTSVTYGGGQFVAVSQDGTNNRVMTSSPNNSLNFDGVNDYVSCGNASALNDTSSISVEAWINKSVSNTYSCIVGKDSYTSNTGYSFWVYSNNKLVLRFGNREYSSITDIPSNTWVHTAATYDSAIGTVKIYINGQLDNTITGVTPPVANSAALYIGTPQDAVGNATYAFGGYIDEVRIWNRALGQAEIQNNVNCSLNPVGQTGLSLLHHFDRGVAGANNTDVTIATDESSNNNVGVLNNFALSGTVSNWAAGAVSNSCPVYVPAGLAGIAGGSQVCQSATVQSPSTYYLDPSNNLIANISPSGSAPVNGNVNTCVKVDASVQTFNGAPYVQRHYDITPAANAATATGTITLYFTQGEFDAYNAVRGAKPALPISSSDAAGISNVKITQFHGTGTIPGSYSGSSVFIDPADANVVWNGSLNRWEVTFPVNGFSGFYVFTNSTNTPLPLTLISFSGLYNNGFNLLQWHTANQINTSAFIVEKSIDARNFIPIATMPATAGGGGNYGYNDNNKLTGKAYYRLKLVDVDGSFTYSNTIAIDNLSSGAMAIYPSPVINTLTISFADAALLHTKATITDAQGKTIRQFIITNPGQQINVKELSKGMYFLQFQNGAVAKIIKD